MILDIQGVFVSSGYSMNSVDIFLEIRSFRGIFEHLDTVQYLLFGLVYAVPAIDSDPLAFIQVLVVLKEVGYLLQCDLRYIPKITHLAVVSGHPVQGAARILASSPDSSVILRTPIGRHWITEPGIRA